MHTPAPPTAVSQLFSDAELAHFVAAAAEQAQAAGGVFALDESIRTYGERTWAAYLREEMRRAGLHEFAARIDPTRFDEHPIIRAAGESGRARKGH